MEGMVKLMLHIVLSNIRNGCRSVLQECFCRCRLMIIPFKLLYFISVVLSSLYHYICLQKHFLCIEN